VWVSKCNVVHEQLVQLIIYLVNITFVRLDALLCTVVFCTTQEGRGGEG